MGGGGKGEKADWCHRVGKVKGGGGRNGGGGKEEQADCCHCPHWQEGGLWLLFNLAVLGGEGWNPSQHISHLKS